MEKFFNFLQGLNMGAETMTKREFQGTIDDCILGKKDKDLVRKVYGMEVCSYEPLDRKSTEVFCKNILAVYRRNRRSYYLCGKNLAYAEKPKA